MSVKALGFFAGVALFIGLICFISSASLEGLLCTLIASVLWAAACIVSAVKVLTEETLHSAGRTARQSVEPMKPLM
jgi:hypothetical protein